MNGQLEEYESPIAGIDYCRDCGLWAEECECDAPER